MLKIKNVDKWSKQKGVQPQPALCVPNQGPAQPSQQAQDHLAWPVERPVVPQPGLPQRLRRRQDQDPQPQDGAPVFNPGGPALGR